MCQFIFITGVYLFQFCLDLLGLLNLGFVGHFSTVAHNFEDRMVAGLPSLMLVLFPHGLVTQVYKKTQNEYFFR